MATQALGFEATVREKNQMTIPRAIAERYHIEAGQTVIFTEQQSEQDGTTFLVRVLPKTYGGILAGVYGHTPEESAEYVRQLREEWD